MDCFSWSLPAGPANQDGVCVFATTNPGSICTHCYARNGRYNFKNVLDSQHVRWLWYSTRLQNRSDELIETFVSAIRSHVRNGYFRVFDSGDFDSPRSIELWHNIIHALPDIQFWIPTRSWRAATEAWHRPLHRLATLPNLAVRPSALEFDADSPRVPGLSDGTSVVLTRTDIKICPKSISHSSCATENCRACWSKTGEIGYQYHGIYGHKKPTKPSDKMMSIRTDTKSTFALLTIKGKDI